MSRRFRSDRFSTTESRGFFRRASHSSASASYGDRSKRISVSHSSLRFDSRPVLSMSIAETMCNSSSCVSRPYMLAVIWGDACPMNFEIWSNVFPVVTGIARALCSQWSLIVVQHLDYSVSEGVGVCM